MELTRDEIRELRKHLTVGNVDDNVLKMVMDLAQEVLDTYTYGVKVDEVALTHNTEFASLDEYVRDFWDKAVERILDVAQVQYGTE